MTISTLTPTADAYDNENRPDSNYGSSTLLALRSVAAEEEDSLLRFALPFATGSGVTVSSAFLRLKIRDHLTGWPGSTDVRARLVTQSWSESKLTWNNKPTDDAAHYVAVTVTDPAEDDEVEWDVSTLVSLIAAGTLSWHGFRLALPTSGLDARRFHSREAVDSTLWPVLEVTWFSAPSPPIDLWPAGNVAVGTATPILAWVSSLVDSSQAKSQVQVSTDSAFGTTDYDSGLVANTDPEWDLGGTAFSATAGVEYWWRVRIQDSAGGVSDYSDPAEFQYQPLGVVDVTAPDDTNTSPSPAVRWTFTGDQAAVEVIVMKANSDGVFTEAWRLPRTATAATAVLVPIGVVNEIGGTYRAIVRVWDSEDRADVPGEPGYSEGTSDFGLIRGSGSAVAAVTATPRADGSPGVELAWDDPPSGSPDFYAIAEDDVIVADEIEPGDVASGGAFATIWWRAKPQVEHTYEILAEYLDGDGVAQIAAAGGTDAATLIVRGKWLVQPGSEQKGVDVDPSTVHLRGPDGPDFDIGMNREVIVATGARSPQVISDQVRGYEGQVTGILLTDADRVQLDEFAALDPSIELRLAYGWDNIRIAISGSPHEAVLPDGARRQVTVPFVQQDERQ